MKTQEYKSFEELRKEIDRRDFRDIEGLRASITAKEYNYFLNVLYPLNWIQGEQESSFLLNECLTENLYYKFFEIYNNKKFSYFCEVVRYKNAMEVDIEVYGV